MLSVYVSQRANFVSDDSHYIDIFRLVKDYF